MARSDLIPEDFSDTSVAQLNAMIRALQASAGPRGATFAGRLVQPSDTLSSLMQRFPQAELESGGGAMRQLNIPSITALLQLIGMLNKQRGASGAY